MDVQLGFEPDDDTYVANGGVEITDKHVKEFYRLVPESPDRVTSKELVERMGLESGGRGPQDNRTLRAIAHVASMLGYLVMADTRGFFRPRTLTEALMAIAFQRRKVVTNLQRIAQLEATAIKHLSR